MKPHDAVLIDLDVTLPVGTRAARQAFLAVTDLAQNAHGVKFKAAPVKWAFGRNKETVHEELTFGKILYVPEPSAEKGSNFLDIK